MFKLKGSVIAVAAALIASPAFSAEVVELNLDDVNSLGIVGGPQALSLGILAEPDGLSVAEQSNSAQHGELHQTLQQYYQGVPILGGDIVLLKNEQTEKYTYVAGSVLKNIEDDVKSVKPLISVRDIDGLAKQIIARDEGTSLDRVKQEQPTQLYIYASESGKAHLAYLFFGFVDVNAVKAPVLIMDANTGEVLEQYNNIPHAKATGEGGNERRGLISYGQGEWDHLSVTKSGNRCTLENQDVRVVNLNNRADYTTISPAYPYNCVDSDNRFVEADVNGAYGVGSEALYNGTKHVQMFRDWYATAALPSKLIMRVHYGNTDKDANNAFWYQGKMSFGDGGSRFHPFTSVSVVGHEVAHGFTENHSGLVYRNQSGGLNESFSDMAGMALKEYIYGRADFIMGNEIYKNSGFMRSMKNPTSDGRSIDHVSRYTTGMDPHHSSGVFNKVFYNLATTPGWNVRYAFEVFLRANERRLWTSNATYQQAGDGACRAAADLGWDGNDIAAALSDVGLSSSYCRAGNKPVGGVTPTVAPTVAPTVTPTTEPTIAPTPDPLPGGAWNSQKVYLAGDKVSHKGKQYVSLWWNQGQEPGTAQWGPWDLVDGGTVPEPTPQPTVAPTVAPTVEPSVTPTNEPGEGCSGVGAWSANQSYSLGDEVVYSDNRYEAIWWSTNVVPTASSAWNIWKKLGGC
ncbi:M4 family metallopeptidase [Motilimonas sp. E26]|uniref:M4 family metallopeptidase n=1 Tax=Motilimonas sp. E26 TaxID=2865674 RepID=UPI001E4BF3C4|nr:M4 family metallopeptidase [Motilimonas sp. E26]MCE0555445.1 M4 family metallopeptidase [Motilimonas sp. E26]